MAADIVFRAPRPDDLVHIAARMRAADAAECRAAGHENLHALLVDGVKHSALAWVAMVNGVPACVFGVRPIFGSLMDEVGVPWMLGTDEVPAHRKALMQMTPAYIRKMLDAFPHLLNFVHADNLRAVAWLKRLGFTVGAAMPYGPHKAMFHLFEMHAHV